MRRSAGSRREPTAAGARSQVRRGCSGAAYLQAGFIGCPGSQTIREDFIMGVKLGFLVTLEAKDGKGEELGEFLRAGREFAAAEGGAGRGGARGGGRRRGGGKLPLVRVRDRRDPLRDLRYLRRRERTPSAHRR